ncbi:MAG TPA: nidogen-like domain-containing protein [Steroidobacteraceae bacterium]|nr:nidogen-like domain-containing protein [Steroidobacteraceae bacterium]
MNAMTKGLIVLAILSSPLLARAAVPPVTTPGFSSNALPICDDCFSAPVPLGFTADFFGNNYTQLFVSNNGYMTFGAGQSNFTPTGLTAAYSGNPIIAPFYGDVDTRGTGTVNYGTGTYGGQAAFAVTWNNVGYFSAQTNKTNTFQAILVSNPGAGAGAFNIIYNYDQIQWETGAASGGVNGLGGFSAAVGYANGSGLTGTYYQVPGSLVPGSFIDSGTSPLINGTNDGTAGQLFFSVVNGTVGPPPPPPTSAPEIDPATAAAGLMLLFGGLLVLRGRQPAKRLTAAA